MKCRLGSGGTKKEGDDPSKGPVGQMGLMIYTEI